MDTCTCVLAMKALGIDNALAMHRVFIRFMVPQLNRGYNMHCNIEDMKICSIGLTDAQGTRASVVPNGTTQHGSIGPLYFELPCFELHASSRLLCKVAFDALPVSAFYTSKRLQTTL